jgi:adenylylsulfate kinase
MTTARLPTFTWWLTGLSGAGKTTLAQALAVHLRTHGEPVCVLDGDELRQGLCSDLGFSPEDRHKNMRRTAQMALLLNQNGVHAIAALISPTTSGRAMARDIVGSANFFEVHVSTPLAVCVARDTKGLYARAQLDPSLGLTGVQATYEEPAEPTLRLDTHTISVAEGVAQLMRLTL